MSVIAFASAKGSPGVTTTVLALAWVWPHIAPGRRVVVVDADVAGGGVATGYLQGAASSGRGILSLATGRSADAVASFWDSLMALDDDGSRLLLAGVTDPAQARVVENSWTPLAGVLDQLDSADAPVDVLVDLGRLGTANEAVALRQRADLMLLVMTSSLTSVATARPALRRLIDERVAAGRGPAVVASMVVGERQPYSSAEIGEVLGSPVMATIVEDSSTASVFSRGTAPGARFGRSPLMRSASAAAEQIRGAVTGDAEVPVFAPATTGAAVGADRDD